MNKSRTHTSIDGVRVNLDALRATINATQSEIARKSGHDQSYVSRAFRGERGWSDRLKEAVCGQLNAQHVALSDLTDPPEGTAQDVVESVEDATEGDTGPKVFPIEDAQNLAYDTRRAKAEGEVNLTFSPRKLANWGAIYRILKADTDMGHDMALGAAYWLAAVYSAGDEERRFLLESYQRRFSLDALEPVDVIEHDPMQHPAEPLVEIFARRGKPVWAFGPTGCGKTHALRAVAKRLSGVEPFRFQGRRDRSAEDFVGTMTAEDGTVYWEPGPLPQAMEAGIPFVIDEPTICDSDVLMALQAVLEGDSLYVTKDGGKRVTITPGFTVMAADNTRGLGESVEYIGTKPLNEAFRDRFVFIEFDYMPDEQERNVVEHIMERDWSESESVESEPEPEPVEETDTLDWTQMGS